MLNTQFPCFSIIIPIFNTEKELPRCVDSILKQEYPNYEIILVDDGSQDQSGELCDQYARKNKQIKVVHQENAGCSAARNTGANMAKGDFLIFVDSDYISGFGEKRGQLLLKLAKRTYEIFLLPLKTEYRMQKAMRKALAF